ncbi:MAG: DsrE family protein [Candidatus Izimaplasma sp.]|nr:DsrE family protein [Candidatus Izimaplasma bacterium]
MMKEQLLVVWKSDNTIDINNFILPYVYNAKANDWFKAVRLLIWGASQKKVIKSEHLQNQIRTFVEEGIDVYACKMCADNVGATDILNNLGVTVMYTGEFLTESLKNPEISVITI